MGFAQAFVDALRHLGPRHAFAVVLACALFLWLPENVADALLISTMRSQHGGWVGGALLLFGAIWLVAIGLNARAWWKLKQLPSQVRKQTRQALGSLSEGERSVLQEAVKSRARTVRLMRGDSNGDTLAARGLLRPVSRLHNGMTWESSYLVPDDVWAVLQEPGALDNASGLAKAGAAGESTPL